MTDAPVPSGTPHEVLAGLGDLTRKVRAAQRGAWFPLLLLGVLTLGGILVNRFTFTRQTLYISCPAFHYPADEGRSIHCSMTRQGLPLYWAIGLVLVYAATALFSIRRSRARGVGTRVRPYVLAGTVLAVLVAATDAWATGHGSQGPSAPFDLWGLHLAPGSGPATFAERFTGEAVSIGLPLLLLSWVERSRALLLFALAYTALALALPVNGWGFPGNTPWSSMPRLSILGAFLLLGALGFAAARSSRERTTP